jgi:hypothetical protein
MADLSDLNSLNQAHIRLHVCPAVHLAVGRTEVQAGDNCNHVEVLWSLDRLGQRIGRKVLTGKFSGVVAGKFAGVLAGMCGWVKAEKFALVSAD